MKLKFNPDPTVPRVVIIAVLMMAELLLMKLVEILSANRVPTTIEFYYIIALALLQLVTYLLLFMHGEGQGESS